MGIIQSQKVIGNIKMGYGLPMNVILTLRKLAFVTLMKIPIMALVIITKTMAMVLSLVMMYGFQEGNMLTHVKVMRME